MIKDCLNKSCSIALAFLVMASTLSFSVQHHFCGDNLVDSAIFSEVKKCCPDSNSDKGISVKNTKCCKDKIEVVEGIELKKIEISNDTRFLSNFLIPKRSIGFIDLDNNSILQLNRAFFQYLPPNLVSDLYQRHQVFLI